MRNERREKIIKVFRENESVVRTMTLRKQRISSRDLEELLDMGDIVKVKTGYYALNESLEKLNDLVNIYFSSKNSTILTCLIPSSSIGSSSIDIINLG